MVKSTINSIILKLIVNEWVMKQREKMVGVIVIHILFES